MHLADTTAVAVRSAGLTEVGLLATAFTMEQDFYRDRLAGHGLRVFPTTRLHVDAAVTAALQPLALSPGQ